MTEPLEGDPRVTAYGRIANMKYLTVELIPDPEIGGFTARVPDIPAYGESAARLNQPSSLRRLELELEDLVRA